MLNPETPLFREGRYLLAEEPDMRDGALYHSVLAAVAEGNATRGGIANYVGRKATDIAHPINVLEDAGLITREADAFRENRSTYRIAEPLITFYHAVMRPVWAQLERPGNAGRVWRASGQRFSGKVLGPRFEEICRAWALNYADPDRLGGLPAKVGQGVLTDAANKSAHEVDVVVTGVADGRTPLLAIGEAKWGEVMGTRHLERLRRIHALLADHGKYDTSSTALMCFSGTGFTAELSNLVKGDPGVLLVDVEELYDFPRRPA